MNAKAENEIIRHGSKPHSEIQKIIHTAYRELKGNRQEAVRAETELLKQKTPCTEQSSLLASVYLKQQ